MKRKMFIMEIVALACFVLTFPGICQGQEWTLKVCAVDQEFDWLYDCNQCPDGYHVLPVDNKFIKKEGLDLPFGVMVAKCVKAIQEFPFKTIAELKDSPAGEYVTQGYLVWRNRYTPCPPGALCAAFLPQIVIAETPRQRADEFDLKEDELLIEALGFINGRWDGMALGTRYRFTVKKIEYQKWEEVVVSYDGVGFESVKE